MTTDEIRSALYDAAKLRVPRRGDHPEQGTSEFIGRLEDYLLQTAFWRGELEEARLFTYDSLQMLRDQWASLEGWQVALPSGSARNPTRDQVIAAKRQVRPDLYDGLEAAKALVERLGDQIRRLKDDDAATSRAYTLVTGS